jgi:hypothetical protein
MSQEVINSYKNVIKQLKILMVQNKEKVYNILRQKDLELANIRNELEEVKKELEIKNAQLDKYINTNNIIKSIGIANNIQNISQLNE